MVSIVFYHSFMNIIFEIVFPQQKKKGRESKLFQKKEINWEADCKSVLYKLDLRFFQRTRSEIFVVRFELTHLLVLLASTSYSNFPITTYELPIFLISLYEVFL